KQTKIPDYLLCPGSEVLLTEPIVLSEQANNSFTAGIQDFYLLLPTGFQFRGVGEEDKPTVQLNGNDFDQLSLDIEFVNNTIVHIQYEIQSSVDLDNIIITDLKLIGTPGSSGDIKRFGGNAVLPVLTNNKLASVTVITNQPLKFTNSYSRDNDFTTFGFLPDPDLPPGERAIIKAIPDNYIDPTLGGSIRLIPINEATNDYAPSEFLGNGVTNDVLNLGAVALDAAFDITINHISVNGCIVESSEQYVVYDHVSPISLDLGITQAGQHIGSKQSLENPNFQTDLTLPPGYAPSPGLSADQINSGDIAGYKLLDLYARIPVNLDTPLVQIISGRYWRSQVKQIPVVVNTVTDNTSPTGFKKDYKWDYTHIINAKSENSNITVDPYDNFRDTTLNNTIFWKGGSLGKIEFTGRYQSTADLTLTVPFKQQVELFVPPIPKIEVSGQSAFLGDTAIFCRSQSSFTLNGWPDANAGLSTGYFELFDAQTNAPIHTLASPNAGFTDNGNGIATLQPGVLFNNYRTIRVEYTFNENNSPSKGTGYYYIKVTPNPVASFSATSVLASAQPIDLGRPSAPNAYCENNLIQFDNTSTFAATGYVANTNPRWTLGDPLSATNTQVTPSASFTYTVNGRYIVTFSVSSQYNCPSQVASDSIYIGAIPNASFSMNGISTATPINVVDNSTVANGPATNSSIFSAQWKYSPSTTYTSVTTNTFTTPGHYTITLLSTTQIARTDQGANPTPLPGCERTFTRPIIIVPALSATDVGIEAIDDFESTDPLKQWQSSSTDNLVSSWQKGDATESSSIELTGNVWATGLSTPYNPGEVSYLYSPSYDLTNLARPKVSFDQVAFMNVNDGVVLEFSTDNFNITDPLKKWYRVGTNSDGNNWYNRSGLASKPGTQVNVVTGISSGDYGWSSVVDTVLHSQHTLSPDIPAAERTQVIFRFALASLAGSSNEGFAFDNFRVGERTRIVLIENFSNAGNTNSVNGVNVEKRESDFLKQNFNTVGTDIVKINYRVGFPNMDPFNDDDPADPSARALYYNISETPLVRMDGGNSGDPQKKYFSDWGAAMYNNRTLKLAQADVQITPPTPSANGGFEFSISVTAHTRLAEDTTILHIAFVESLIPMSSLSNTDKGLVATGETSFEYVLKKMIPSALGTRLDAVLLKGQTKTFGPFEWNPDLGKLYNAPNDLALIAFLQNEVTKEIYQAKILTGLTDPTLVTDVEDPDYVTKIQLFPNPANHEVNIQLPAAVTKSTPVEMFDTYGKTVYQSSFKAGEQIKTISTSELTSGVYLIQLSTPDGKIARRKIMVVHR
ncbi:MAG TPA: T9SS type A sorting domain-containing protein, partial [Cyclobacteriaceae bacterium]|nr:T9SS type A sorting domain-containing protein [Cyclobacteriaceae bacterium]